MGHRIQRMENMVNAVNGGPGKKNDIEPMSGHEARKAWRKGKLSDAEFTQYEAQSSTRKSELQDIHGRKTGKQIHKVEYASNKQKQKAQKRTSASENMDAKGIEMNKRGYAKRRQVTGADRLRGGTIVDYDDISPVDTKKVITKYTKHGDIKSTKTKKVIGHHGKDKMKVVEISKKLGPASKRTEEGRWFEKGGTKIRKTPSAQTAFKAGMFAAAGIYGSFAIKSHKNRIKFDK